MDEIINYLKDIQEDLVGIIIPLIITAVVSIFSLVFNTVTKLIITMRRYMVEQHLLKKKIYPKFKDKIIHIDYKFTNMKNNNLYIDIMTSLSKYISFKSNEIDYKKNNGSEINDIDKFINLMDKYLEEIKDFHTLFIEAEMPDLPIFDIRLKCKIKKNIALNFYFSVLISKLLNKDISGEYVIESLKNFKKKYGYEFDERILEQTDSIFDLWMVKHGII